MTYELECQIAELAVQRACLLTKRVFHEKSKGELAKDDKSPVTKGDFGAQALIIKAMALDDDRPRYKAIVVCSLYPIYSCC